MWITFAFLSFLSTFFKQGKKLGFALLLVCFPPDFTDSIITIILLILKINKGESMIHFSINKNLFLQALNTTKRAISSKNAIPILSTVKN